MSLVGFVCPQHDPLSSELVRFVDEFESGVAFEVSFGEGAGDLVERLGLRPGEEHLHISVAALAVGEPYRVGLLVVVDFWSPFLAVGVVGASPGTRTRKPARGAAF